MTRIKNFYREAWAKEVMLSSNMSQEEAFEYVDGRMEEYYQERVMGDYNE